MNILKKLFDHEYKEINRFEKFADKIDSYSDEYSKLTDKKMKKNT